MLEWLAIPAIYTVGKFIINIHNKSQASKIINNNLILLSKAHNQLQNFYNLNDRYLNYRLFQSWFSDNQKIIDIIKSIKPEIVNSLSENNISLKETANFIDNGQHVRDNINNEFIGQWLVP